MPSPIVQSGILDGGVGVHHYFPSIAVNSANDALVGFSRSNTSRFVEGVYTGRLGTDPPGTMRPIAVLKGGLDSYEKRFTGTRIRWGDYSASVVDPSDDVSFWTIQEYAELDVGPGPNDDRWGTWWGKIDVITSVAGGTLPTKTVLFQNYPNPFNPSTTIHYSLTRSSFVTLKVYDLLGQEVETLEAAEKSAGEHSVKWEPRNLAGGMYLCRLRAADYLDTKKLIFSK
jgi:hypothetical protein